MKKTIKISRSGFHNVGNFSWINYFVEILSYRYNVVIDSDSPDIVVYSNLNYISDTIDYYTNKIIRGIDSYSNDVKKIFISGEANPDYYAHINHNSNYYALGYEHIDHPRYLRFPTYILDAYVLHNEGGLFRDNFSWITDTKSGEDIYNSKKHFCSIVQNSFNADRQKMCDLIESKYWIKACGNFKNTVSDDEQLNMMKYHNYSNKEYMGKIDGLTYRDKVNFFKDCFFNISFQYTNTDYLTQEKIIHAFAANTIPIFWGNKFIEQEGFNPDSFINLHSFDSFENAFAYIDSLYQDKDKMINVLSAPIFKNNILPDYFNNNYLLSFLEKIIEN